MKRYYVLTVAILAVTAVVHVTILNAQAAAGREHASVSWLDVPARIGSYEQIGADANINEHVQRVLETSTVLIRSYRSPWSRPVELTIVYAGSTRRSLHFPEVCLVGTGWEVQLQEMMPVSFLFNAKKLVLVKGQDRQAVLYWFKTGDKLTGNYFLNAFHWARNQLAFGSPTSAMIKLATPIGPEGEAAAFSILEDFAVKLAPVLLDRVS